MSVASNGTEAEELDDMELYQLIDDTASATTYDSDTEKKMKKKINKPPRTPKSPYLSSTKLGPKKAPVWRSLKGTGLMHTENPMATVPRQLWLASLKQGNGLTQPLKASSDIGQAWTTPTSSTPEYLKEALGMKKPKYSRSSSNGYVPGTPDYKEKEDMYDQIIDLKKMLQAQKTEADIMKTKLRRLEEENNRKDRQIEQLLDPSRSSDFARSLVDTKSDSSLVVNNLRQKVLKLEKQCKEKDSALSKLQSELKTTSLEEMKIAMETYYEEIQRLQTLLVRAEATGRRSPPESKESQKQQKVLKSAVMRLSKQIKELQEENGSLKADLNRAMSQSPTSTRKKDYTEWSKQRLVRRISELEKLEKLEKPNSSSTEQEIGARVTVVANSAQGDVSFLPKSDLHEECERLRTILKKVKEDRGTLQTLLATKESEIRKLQQEKANLDMQLQKAKERNEEREEIRRLNQKIKNLEAKLEDEKCEKESILEDMKKTASQGSRPNSAKSAASRPGSASSASGKKQQERQNAAELIQKNWRLYKSRKEKVGVEDMEETAVLLQSVLRGHLARQTILSSPSEARSSSLGANILQDPSTSQNYSLTDVSKDEDDAVSFLQAAFRGHLARKKLLENSELTARVSSNRKSSRESMKSPRSRISSSQDVPYSLASESSEECTEDPIFGEERAESRLRKVASQRPPSALGRRQQREEEVPSDDSDDIIVVPPSRPPRRKDSDF
uniref:IQ motif-containing E n=1 Tax=Xenopus tropicalis TaxID=8364 RepID=F6UQ91_XENTR